MEEKKSLRLLDIKTIRWYDMKDENIKGVACLVTIKHGDDEEQVMFSKFPQEYNILI